MLNNLSNNKQNNITFNAETDVPITKKPNDTWIINSNGYTNTDGNIDVTNNTINLNTSFIDVMNISIVGGNNISVLFDNNTWTIASEAVSGSNNISVLNSSQINDTSISVGSSTSEVGNALIGEWGGSYQFAAYSHKTNNTLGNYALIQRANTDPDKNTYLNCRSGGGIRFSQNNVDTMMLQDVSNYTSLELNAPS